VDESEERDRVAGSRRKGEERAAGRRHQAARKGDGDEDEKEREREETKKKKNTRSMKSKGKRWKELRKKVAIR